MMSAVLTIPSQTDTSAPQPTFTHFLPPELLPCDPDIRNRDTPEQVEFTKQLGADILDRGVQIPLICYDDSGRPRVEDGETRRRAMLLVGYAKPVPILLYPSKPDPAALLLGTLQANALRAGMSDLEYAPVYLRLMELNKWSPAELWRQLKVNPATGTKRLAISTKLCEQVKALVASGTLAVRAAYAISRISDVPIQIDVADKFVRGALCVEGVEAEVSRILKGSKRPVKEKPLILIQGEIEVVVQRSVTLDSIAAALEGLVTVVKRLMKEKRGIEYLVLELQPT